jgi:hypothetical protein
MSFAAKPSTWTFGISKIVIEGHTLATRGCEGPMPKNTQATSYQTRVNGRCIAFRR